MLKREFKRSQVENLPGFHQATLTYSLVKKKFQKKTVFYIFEGGLLNVPFYPQHLLHTGI